MKIREIRGSIIFALPSVGALPLPASFLIRHPAGAIQDVRMQSMTGFGRGTHTTERWLASVEAAAINRKQVEIVANLPRPLQSLESRVRQATLPHISRGRVQISVRIENSEGEASAQIRINPALAKSFESAFSDLSLIISRPLLPEPSDFLRQPGIIEVCEQEEVDPEVAWEAISPALEQAITNLNAMRSSEGIHLRDDLLARLGQLMAFTQTITGHAPGRMIRQKELLLKRLSNLGIPLELDDERLAKELALFADRCDISEEVTRLESHFAKFHEYVHSEEPAGRPLDFLCQELFREFNTIGSKANDPLIAQTVVESKTELEKIREQVQNIE
ncbi:MAG: YicC family protein [Verrucomicrobia bacterium]|nr:YicC family protein [Verrucomicrobiota bacterium]